MSIIFLSILLGAVAGTLSGLLGIGGGSVVVPGLAFLFAMYGMPHANVLHLAMGTSLAAMIITSLSSIRAHHRFGNVQWGLWLRIAPGIVLGAIFGTNISGFLRTDSLSVLFAIFLILVALRMFFLIKPKPSRPLPSTFAICAGGFLVGTVSGLLGIGGATMTIPLLVFFSVPMHRAAGTAVATTLPIAVVGSISVIVIGWHAPNLPHLWTLGYVLWPVALGVGLGSASCAPVGAWLAQRASVTNLKRIFASFLFITAIGMMLR